MVVGIAAVAGWVIIAVDMRSSFGSQILFLICFFLFFFFFARARGGGCFDLGGGCG
jgi:hypothetical protein